MAEHYIVLSRKYRPKDLKDLIGQDVLAKSLKSCLDSNRVPHAFLFHGIRGVGKTTSARILARCLSCLKPESQDRVTSSPCGICKSCTAIDKDSHMDIMEFDAASRTGVDDVREIIDSSQYIPIFGKFKIFIIDEVHMLSKSAFNALLKILEEPPAHVKFIFATTEIHKIPDTILSRCMTFQLKPIPLDVLSEHLISVSEKEGVTLKKDASDIITEESDGSVRDALSILDQAMMLSNDAHIITVDIVVSMLGSARLSDIDNLLQLILDSKTKEALGESEKFIQNGCDPFMLFKGLQSALYKLISESANSDKKRLSNLLYLWQILLRQTENMKNANRPEYVLNAAIVILSHTASFPNIEDLMIKDDSRTYSQNLVGEILNKFRGTIVSEIE